MGPDNNFCHSPPKCYSKFMTLIKVCACVVRQTERCSKCEGTVMELGVTEFSGMQNPNHLAIEKAPE